MSNNKFNVKLITTNTRLGFVDVKAMCERQEPGTCDRKGEPDNIYHSAVVAYGLVYEYMFDLGIEVTDEKKYFSDNDPIWIDGEFETEMSQKEFEVWIEKIQDIKFGQNNFHVSDNNCSHFLHAAAEFLGGKEPSKQSGQRDWLIRNRHLAVAIQDMLVGQRDSPNPSDVEPICTFE